MRGRRRSEAGWKNALLVMQAGLATVAASIQSSETDLHHAK
jgi:hypothetical protein